jgi:hypothetical protein
MTKDEALKLALEFIEQINKYGWKYKCEAQMYEAITAIEEVLAQPEQEQDNAYIYASNLAKTIWQKHYMKESPKFALLDTTEGVLTQIDNMTCGLVRETAQQEQEPWPEEPTGHMARGVKPSKISNAITEIYALFGAAHNADINLTGLNIVLNNLAQPEQGEPVAWEQFHEHMGGPFYVAPQRTWIGLTDDDWNSTPYDTEFRAGAEWAEAKLKERNT